MRWMILRVRGGGVGWIILRLVPGLGSCDVGEW